MRRSSLFRNWAAGGIAVMAIMPIALSAQNQTGRSTEKTEQEECLEKAAEHKNEDERRREEEKCGLIAPAEPSVARRTNLLPLLGLPAAVAGAAATAALAGGEPASP
jgi:hypothetical protein